VKRLIALILGALAIAVIAGCGSSDSTASLPKPQFVKKAEAICTVHHDNIEAKFLPVAEKDGGKLSSAGVSKAVEVVMVPELQAEAEQIRALGTPKDGEEDVNAMLDSFEQGIEEIERTADNPGNTVPAIVEANKMAKAFGLKVCLTS